MARPSIGSRKRLLASAIYWKVEGWIENNKWWSIALPRCLQALHFLTSLVQNWNYRNLQWFSSSIQLRLPSYHSWLCNFGTWSPFRGRELPAINHNWRIRAWRSWKWKPNTNVIDCRNADYESSRGRARKNLLNYSKSSHDSTRPTYAHSQAHSRAILLGHTFSLWRSKQPRAHGFQHLRGFQLLSFDCKQSALKESEERSGWGPEVRASGGPWWWSWVTRNRSRLKGLPVFHQQPSQI